MPRKRVHMTATGHHKDYHIIFILATGVPHFWKIQPNNKGIIPKPPRGDEKRCVAAVAGSLEIPFNGLVQISHGLHVAVFHGVDDAVIHMALQDG